MMKVKCVTWAVKLPINNARERPKPMSCSIELCLSLCLSVCLSVSDRDRMQ